MFGNNYADGGFLKLFDATSEIFALYLGDKKEEAYTLMRECMIGHMVNSYMESTRKVWLPPMHQGSQSEELQEYRLLNNIINDIVDERMEYFNS